MSAPPGGRSPMFVLSAAGFIATRTSGWSPGVWISDDEKLIWKPDTPGRDPAGARISAGKSGRVLMSLPKTAAVRVNWVPVSCIPSPESPAKRIVTRSSSWSCGSCARVSVVIRSLSALCLVHALVRSWWEVEELLGERLGQVLEDVLGPDDAHEVVLVVEQWHVPVAARLHEVDRVADRLLEVEVVPARRHHCLDRLVEVDVAADDAAEDVTLREQADESAIGLGHEDRIARSGPLDRGDTVGEARAGRDRHRLVAADHHQSLVEDRRDALYDRAF